MMMETTDEVFQQLQGFLCRGGTFSTLQERKTEEHIMSPLDYLKQEVAQGRENESDGSMV